MSQQPASTIELPPSLEAFFWDYDFAALTWEGDRDLIIARVLAAGDWHAVSWLRSQLGDAALRRWLLEHRGGGLSPQRLRFWQLVLRLARAAHLHVTQADAAGGRSSFSLAWKRASVASPQARMAVAAPLGQEYSRVMAAALARAA